MSNKNLLGVLGVLAIMAAMDDTLPNVVEINDGKTKRRIPEYEKLNQYSEEAAQFYREQRAQRKKENYNKRNKK